MDIFHRYAMLSFTAENVLARVIDVSIVNFIFDPQTVTIEEGDSVRWTNNDAVTHTATSTSNPSVWDSGNLSFGESYIFQFTSSGSFPYYCKIHPSMTGTVEVQSATAVEHGSSQQNIPVQLFLGQNYPNPFNQNTIIRYKISGDQPAHIVIAIYNIQGQKLAELVNGMQSPGEHTIQWNGKDHWGNIVSSGIYLYRLKHDAFHQIRRMTLLQ
jgi:plastocyanin